MQVMIQNAIITPRLREKNGITELVLFSSSLSMLREENLKISIPGNCKLSIKVKNASSHLVPLQRKVRKIRIEKWKIKKIRFERPKSDVLLLQRTQCDQKIFKVVLPSYEFMRYIFVSWVINGWWHRFVSVVFVHLFWFSLNQHSAAQ